MKATPATAGTVSVQAVCGQQGWGAEEGHKAFQKLDEAVRTTVTPLFDLDFEGVLRVDVSWCREAIGGLVSRYRGQLAFFVTNASPSIEENIDAALARLDLTIIARRDEDRFVLLGSPLREHLLVVLEIVEKQGEATSSDVVEHVRGLTVTNCNNRLKALVSAGLVLRQVRAGAGGGKEYVYRALR